MIKVWRKGNFIFFHIRKGVVPYDINISLISNYEYYKIMRYHLLMKNWFTSDHLEQLDEIFQSINKGGNYANNGD